MKRLLIIITFFSLIPSVKAQYGVNLSIAAAETEKIDSVLYISFEINTGRGLNRKGRTIILQPQITDGRNTVSLSPVMIENRRARLKRFRFKPDKDHTLTNNTLTIIESGASTVYKATVGYRSWMSGAGIISEILSENCCTSILDTIVLGNCVIPSDIEDIITANPEQEESFISDESVAEEIAGVLPFVLPFSDFDPRYATRFYDDERDNAITIYFRINDYEIDPRYADNHQSLSNLIAAIDLIAGSNDSEVKLVVVAGFASPDGPFAFNDRLAWERAVSVKEYIIKNGGIADELISLYNGSADWQGLRLLVSNDRTMPHREEVLRIIDNYPVWDPATQTGRMSRIMNLRSGDVYRYMAAHLFPRLRNGAFIRVYYENKIQ